MAFLLLRGRGTLQNRLQVRFAWVFVGIPFNMSESFTFIDTLQTVRGVTRAFEGLQDPLLMAHRVYAGVICAKQSHVC